MINLLRLGGADLDSQGIQVEEADQTSERYVITFYANRYGDRDRDLTDHHDRAEVNLPPALLADLADKALEALPPDHRRRVLDRHDA